MRRAVVCGVVVAALIAGALATFGLRTHARAAVARVDGVTRTAPGARAGVTRPIPGARARPHLNYSGACFVSIPDCAQTPCVEFVRSGAETAVPVPADAVERAVPVRPATTCRSPARPPTNTLKTKPSPAEADSLSAALQAALSTLTHQLGTHRPGARR